MNAIVEQLTVWPGERYLCNVRRAGRLALYAQATRRRSMITPRMLWGCMWLMGIE